MIKENFIELLEESFVKYWDKPMYTDYPGTEIKTYKDVAQEVFKFHIIFENAGLKKGDKIALVGRNCTNWAIIYMATVTYGAVIVPIMPDFKPDDIHHIVNHSESLYLFAAVNIWKGLDPKKMNELKAVRLLEDFSAVISAESTGENNASTNIENAFHKKFPEGVQKSDVRFVPVDNLEIAVLNYTSGTTGFSKGVMISANSLAGNITFGREKIPVDECSKLVSFLPLAHTYGCAFDFLLGVIKGLHVHFISKPPSPQILLPAFKEVKPQIILTVPLIIEKVYKKKIMPTINKPIMKILLAIPGINLILHAKIRKSLLDTFGGNINEMVFGGAPLNEEAEAFFRKIKFPFSIGYGMTECGPLISYDGYKTTKAGSAGKLLENLEMKIDSTDPYSVPGEILIRGEHVMNGYYKNEEASKEMLDEDGWLHTGDMGITDAEEYIYIRGRSKSMILGPSGQNIYPEEIEARLNNLPYVAESIVLEDKNHKLFALVYPDADQIKADKLTDEQLNTAMNENRKSLNKAVKGYETLTRLELHPDEFEKTPKKSIKRFKYQQV